MPHPRETAALPPVKSGLQRPQFYPSRPFAANGAPLKLQLATSTGLKVFTAHGAGYVAVSGARFEQPLVVTPDQVLTDWPARDFPGLDESHFAYFLELRPEVLLLGTGPQLRFPHPRLYRQLTDARIGVESMNTPAACRTFNILVAEGRKVVAAVLL